MFKSGFVSVIGRSNVGKSTLLNRVLGEKLTIISDKPQTTRNKIQLIYTDENMQAIFLDTPGIQTPKNKLGDYMLKVSMSTLNEVDVITYIVDTTEEIGKLDSEIIEKLRLVNTKIILLINKIDKIASDKVNELVEMYTKVGIFEQIIPISALNGDNIEGYLTSLRNTLPDGPMYYDKDSVTDQPIRQIVQELIREKALINLSDELPHGIAITIEKFKERQDKNLIDIDATIIVEKKSHKGMVIGKKGSMIKKIGTDARIDIEQLLDTKVNLKLWVKIDEEWRNKDSRLRYLGYN
ncbi:GTPase Era [Finegoldia magna]|uniref:GTPase Era n=1 Tax=Finegoldia magna TaxID=1260 RepID=A0A133MXW7_FINMA|nr:GTPase Era [Finegoldia magna]EFK93459.1 ribosome biogenesis GTPase Era [Finegoldia magna ACS-171-V-Col3]EGS33745.1 GTP-binding protein Era [Finegoldia magna SY403409CC001050417]KXA08886.1 ribosome biogenesis GTPase Era [Finegoldia magna]MBS6928178.1 GTPase Era [Finegoldia magna]MDU1212941.1 GTPase Era [Finegoldia magna]